MFSKGVIISSFHLLHTIRNQRISYRNFQQEKGYLLTLPFIALDFLSKANWITLSQNQWNLTKKSEFYSMRSINQSRLRTFLKESILTIQPDWAFYLYKGRREFFNSPLPKKEKEDLLSLFHYLDLIEKNDFQTNQWWDELAIFFTPDNANQVAQGRIGERLSFEYEWERTGKKPHWESLYSNFSGYDILSTEKMKPLKIEVKTCLSTGSFYVSKREWEEAQKEENYLFHIWLLQPTYTLYCFSPSVLKPHVPISQKFSEWTEAKFSLPFSFLTPFLTHKKKLSKC